MSVKEINFEDQKGESTRNGHKPGWKFVHIRKPIT